MDKFSKWVSIWGNAVSNGENRPEGYAKDITLRYPVKSAFEGDAIRLTFDNYCGTEAITLSKVTVLINGRFHVILFDGKMSVTIPAGERTVSDELEIQIKEWDTITVSMYLGDFTQMRSCVYVQGPLSCDSLYAVGDQTEVEDISIDISLPKSIVYFLSNISVRTAEKNHAIVCYGDSITAQDWPDYLALRCRELGFKNTSIIRRATSGSRILREYSCLKYLSYGLKGSKRFDHEVPTDGADAVIIQQGINDIIHPVGTDVNPFRPMSDLPTAEELIDGLKYYIEHARSFGLKVYVGTLLPIEGWRTYAPFREELKNAYNEFIRTTDLIDGCIDFDKAVRDPKNPAAFNKGNDSGDHLHPSALGYKTMAEAVDEKIIK